jgi:hypothetical protein
MNQEQWIHRCKVKMESLQGRDQEHVATLNDLIKQEFIQGPDTLLQGDQYLLNWNILTLLEKSLPYKKGWLVRTQTARQRAHRIRIKDQKATLRSKQTSRLYKWMKVHKENSNRIWREPSPGMRLEGHEDDEDMLAGVASEVLRDDQSRNEQEPTRRPASSDPQSKRQTTNDQIYHAHLRGDYDELLTCL